MKHHFPRRWLVCIGCTALLFISTGLMSNAFSTYIPYLLSRYGLTNAQASLLTTARCLSSLASVLFVEQFYRRFSLRFGTTLAVILAAAACFIYATARNFPAFFLGAVISGFSYTLGGIVPVSIAIGRWFDHKRGTALGICTAGSGLATVVMPPILTAANDTIGTPATFALEAGFCAILGLLICLCLRCNQPEETEMSAVHHDSNGSSVSANPIPRKDLSPALRRLMLMTLFLIGADGNAGFSHLTVLYTSFGFSSMTVAAAMSLVGVLLMAAKCFYGVITDKIGANFANLLFTAILVCGHIMCCLTISGNVILLYLAQICFGIGMSIFSVGLPVWAADLSTPEHTSRLVQQFQTAYSVGALIFSPIPGQIADYTGSYLPAFLLLGGFSVWILAALQLTYRLHCKERMAVHIKPGAADAQSN